MVSKKKAGFSKSKSKIDISEKALCGALEMTRKLVSIINKIPVTVFLWKAEKYWPAEFVSENITQFGYKVEDFISGKLLYGKIVHPEDLKKVEEELDRRAKEGYTEFTQEYRILTKSGEVRWVEERTFIEADEEDVKYYKGIVQDITERKRAEKMLYIERDLGIALSSAKNMQTTLDLLLSACLQIDEIDAGGIYLIEENGDMVLETYNGFSPLFVKYASHFSSMSPNVKLVMVGHPVYKQHIDLLLTSRDEILKQEELRAAAVIPVKYENEVIAAFYLASHVEYEFSDQTRTVIETIATQFGAFISRIRTEEKLRECMRKKN